MGSKEMIKQVHFQKGPHIQMNLDQKKKKRKRKKKEWKGSKYKYMKNNNTGLSFLVIFVIR